MSAHFEKDRRYHETIANEYNHVVVRPRALTNDRAFGRIGKVLRGGDAMLDLGCGTGHMSLRFAKRYRFVTAVDHSDAMLDQARRSFEQARLSNIRIICSDVFAFLESCPNAAFDLVAATGFLHHVREDDLPTLLKQIHRVMRPGGQFLMQEPIMLPAAAVPPALERWNADSIVMKIHYHSQGEAPDEKPLDREPLLALLRACGFAVQQAGRNWEVFPKRLPPTVKDRLAAFWFNVLYGGRGNVLTLCCEKGA